jgi:hypothetical protein
VAILAALPRNVILDCEQLKSRTLRTRERAFGSHAMLRSFKLFVGPDCVDADGEIRVGAHQEASGLPVAAAGRGASRPLSIINAMVITIVAA